VRPRRGDGVVAEDEGLEATAHGRRY
jgi:hypothetical protein